MQSYHYEKRTFVIIHPCGLTAVVIDKVTLTSVASGYLVLWLMHILNNDGNALWMMFVNAVKLLES